MTFKEALTARLMAAVDIAQATAGAIGWSRRLPGLPAITMQIVADPRPQHFKGFESTRPTTVQVDVWSIDDSIAEALRDRCIAVLTPADASLGIAFQRALVTGVRSGAEPEQSGAPQRQRGELYRESIDFIFTHNAN